MKKEILDLVNDLGKSNKEILDLITYIKEGDIVQITDKTNKWFPCLLIVSEVTSWGIMGYVNIPLEGVAFYRIENGKFEKVGSAVLIRE